MSKCNLVQEGVFITPTKSGANEKALISENHSDQYTSELIKLMKKNHMDPKLANCYSVGILISLGPM